VADAGQRNAVRVAQLSLKLKRRNRAGVIRWGGRIVIAAFGVELIQREAVGMVVHVLVGIMFAQSGVHHRAHVTCEPSSTGGRGDQFTICRYNLRHASPVTCLDLKHIMVVVVVVVVRPPHTAASAVIVNQEVAGRCWHRTAAPEGTSVVLVHVPWIRRLFPRLIRHVAGRILVSRHGAGGREGFSRMRIVVH
jgi:hypothetical protein